MFLSYIRPSNRKDIIRLKFLELPYRLWFKLSSGNRLAFKALIATGLIPYVIYQGIFKLMRFENKAKLRATLDEDEKKIIEMLDKIKLK